jgi:hypothetical protein
MPMIVIFSFIALIIQRKFKVLLAVILILLPSIYIIASWYYIHYGCTLGCRPITEFYGPIILLFAYSIRPVLKKKWFSVSFIVVGLCSLFYNQILHYQYSNFILNSCEMNEEKFKMIFLKTHPYYAYSTYDLWNFESFEKKQIKDSICNLSFSIHQNKPKDLNTIEIVGINSQTSNILIELDLKIKMNQNINESVLTMLLTENNQYLDLHHFLLKRVVKKNNEWVSYQYQIYISKPIKKCKLDFTLESINNKADTDLKIETVKIKSIDL